jgi:hypothetical protein
VSSHFKEIMIDPMRQHIIQTVLKPKTLSCPVIDKDGSAFDCQILRSCMTATADAAKVVNPMYPRTIAATKDDMVSNIRIILPELTGIELLNPMVVVAFERKPVYVTQLVTS